MKQQILKQNLKTHNSHLVGFPRLNWRTKLVFLQYQGHLNNSKHMRFLNKASQAILITETYTFLSCQLQDNFHMEVGGQFQQL